MSSKFTDYYTEQSVLGGLMSSTTENEEVVLGLIDTLNEDDFTSIAHKKIFSAIKRVSDSGTKANAVSVNGELEQSGESKAVGGFGYLVECSRSISSIYMISGFAQRLKDLSQARNVINSLSEGLAKINAANVSNLIDVVGQVQTDITQLESGHAVETHHIMVGVDKSLEIIESMINGDYWKYKAKLGLPDIDKAFGGFNNTDLIVVGGRPGMGKTMFSTAVARSVALSQSKPVVFYSLEMPDWQISERIAFHHAGVDKESVIGDESAKMDMDTAWAKLSKALGEIKEAPIYINDKPAISIHEIRSNARKMHKKLGGIGVIIVDYLQKMTMSNPDNMNQSVGEIATGLKNLAKELKCPVIALAQLNRNLEQRTNKRPLNADLRESGVIEQEADVIFMIYRDEKYNPNTDMKGITEIICTKSRHSPGAEKTYYFTNVRGGLDSVPIETISNIVNGMEI